MDLRQLEYFVGVVDHGGFTRAAEALLVSQPALSYGIRTLEAELGVELFSRIGRRVVLTSAGAAVLDPARQTLRGAMTVRAAATAVAGLTTGRLDLATLSTLAADPVARWIGAFRSAYPGVSVRAREPEDADGVLRLVATGECELGLAEVTTSLDDLVVEVSFDQEMLAVCPPGFALRAGALELDTLARVPIVLTPPGTSTRRLVDAAFAEAGSAPIVAVETDGRDALVPLVLAGAGVTFLPEPLAVRAGSLGAVVARTRPRIVRRVGLVRRPGAPSPAATAFLEVARREVKARRRQRPRRPSPTGRARPGSSATPRFP